MAFDIQAGQRRTVVRCNCLQAADVTARPGTKRFGGVWCSKRNERWRLAPASSIGCPLYVVAALVANHAHSTFDDFRRRQDRQLRSSTADGDQRLRADLEVCGRRGWE
jgi:hypothetical protein